MHDSDVGEESVRSLRVSRQRHAHRVSTGYEAGLTGSGATDAEDSVLVVHVSNTQSQRFART